MDLDLLAQRRHLAATALLACMLSGCGGGGGGGADAQSPNTPPSASAAPAAGLAATQDAPRPQPPPDPPAAAAAVAAEAVDAPIAQPAVATPSAPIAEADASANCVDAAQLRDALQGVDERAAALWNATAGDEMSTSCVSSTRLLALALSLGPAAAWAADKLPALLNREIPWGVAPSDVLSRNPLPWLPAMAEAGVRSVRGFHIAPNVDGVAPINAAGLSAVGFLLWHPAELTLPVNDLRGWRRYVTEQVRRHKGRVKYWEVWNEPPNFTADQSPASYAKVVAVAFEAAKAVDPGVQVGLAAKSNHVNFLAETIAAGAAGKYDFVTLHPYEVAGWIPQGWEGHFMSIAPRVRHMLREKDPAKAAVPLWFTEIGYSVGSTAATGPGPNTQSDTLLKVYTMALAQGVGRTYWFDPSDSEGLTMGLTTADGTRRPAWHALRSLTTHLGARPRYLGWTQPGNAYYGFVFKTPQGVLLSAWARPGQPAALALASDVRWIDPRTGAARTTRTGSLTDAPALLLAPTGSAQARLWLGEAAASIGKPFAWNGDHSASAAVRLTAGALPDGVFMVKAPPATVVNTVAEFDMAGTPGPCFAVDPEFSTYGTQALRVTAVVRGHGSGEPGFTLKYESDAPIAAANDNGLVAVADGWFPITGTTFHEKTWSLPNARFVGKYGYNFCFDAGTPAQGAFSIRSVTVSR